MINESSNLADFVRFRQILMHALNNLCRLLKAAIMYANDSPTYYTTGFISEAPIYSYPGRTIIS